MIKAHPTKYRGIQFRSRLEARWACFFDLADWEWQYEPIDLIGWTPDFRVELLCGHSECPPKHALLVEVKPYFSVKEFEGHPCMDFPYGVNDRGTRIPADASAAFGYHPSVTYWEMVHGAGGGCETIDAGRWVNGDINTMWNEAGNIVQWWP